MKIREEIKRYAKDDDKDALEWLFSKWHWSSEWGFVAKCTFRDKPYPNNHRIWTPTEAGRILYDNRSKFKSVITHDITE